MRHNGKETLPTHASAFILQTGAARRIRTPISSLKRRVRCRYAIAACALGWIRTNTASGLGRAPLPVGPQERMVAPGRFERPRGFPHDGLSVACLPVPSTARYWSLRVESHHRPPACRAGALLRSYAEKSGCQTGIRTPAPAFRAQCPTARRSGNGGSPGEIRTRFACLKDRRPNP